MAAVFVTVAAVFAVKLAVFPAKLPVFVVVAAIFPILVAVFAVVAAEFKPIKLVNIPHNAVAAGIIALIIPSPTASIDKAPATANIVGARFPPSLSLSDMKS